MADVGARILTAEEGMAEAVARIQTGGLVAFPTETVYGLAANARDADAVAAIFTAKGRPATNPVIVHVADSPAAVALAGNWSDAASALAARFWPGPLTLVVEKPPQIPNIVTANGATVGLRVPAHPVALELLRRSGLPLAAPSANRSEAVSPTTAAHVAESLGPFVDDLLILDGGPSDVGIESTVLDITGAVPRILRPGILGLAELREVAPDVVAAATADAIVRAPGQMPRHYAPDAETRLFSGRDIAAAARPGDGVLLLRSNPNIPFGARVVCLPPRPDAYAGYLYATLRALDAVGVARILIETPPDEPAWAAINDRLRRAAA
jgi:L-threonylcarbamoyladenylate synthase